MLALVLWIGRLAWPKARRCPLEPAGGENSRVTRGSRPVLSRASPQPQEESSSRRQSCALGESRAELGEGMERPEKIAGKH